jgi:hypothetical protein
MLHSKHSWQIRSEGAEKAIGVHDTKEGAVATGKRVAKNHQPSRLVIHKENGAIQLAYTFG